MTAVTAFFTNFAFVFSHIILKVHVWWRDAVVLASVVQWLKLLSLKFVILRSIFYWFIWDCHALLVHMLIHRLFQDYELTIKVRQIK